MKEHPLARMFPGWFPPCENHPLVWDKLMEIGVEMAFKTRHFQLFGYPFRYASNTVRYDFKHKIPSK